MLGILRGSSVTEWFGNLALAPFYALHAAIFAQNVSNTDADKASCKKFKVKQQILYTPQLYISTLMNLPAFYLPEKGDL